MTDFSRLSEKVAAALIVGLLATFPARADNVPAKLICSEHSGDKDRLKAFQTDLDFEYSNGLFRAERSPGRPGKETFWGITGPSGNTLFLGDGYFESGGAWNYEFSGKRNPTGKFTLKGKLTSTKGPVGTRACALVFG